MSESAFVALGSNAGERWASLSEAVRRIGSLPGTEVAGVSDVWETAPVGKIDQPPFLNAVVWICTGQPPAALMDALLSVESEMGRVRAERWGPRVIDLDLILHGDTVLETEKLTLPHPRMRERLFVLVPLLSLDGSLRDPLSGELLAEIAKRIDHPGWGERRGPLER